MPQPQNTLDPKEERLIEAHRQIGRLQESNDLITEDNSRLEDENSELRQEVKRLTERNRSLENDTIADNANRATINEMLDEFEQAIKKRKDTK